MAEYEERERAFNDSLPGLFSNYAKSIGIADSESKMQYLEFVKAIFSEPNLTIDQKISIINSENPLSIGLSIPVASVIDISPFGMDEANLKMSMTVHASDVSTTKSEASAEGSASATFGWGLIKGSVKMKASASTASSRKRSSDYTATTDAELKMRRQPTPETLSKIMDTFGEVAGEAMKLNQQIIAAQVANAGNEMETKPDLIEESPKSE